MYSNALKKHLKIAIQIEKEKGQFKYDWCDTWQETRREHDIMRVHEILDELVCCPITKIKKQKLFDMLNDIDMILSQYRQEYK